VQRCSSQELELVVLFDRLDSTLEGTVSAAQFVPFCTPAVNLFPHRADRIHLSERVHEHQVIADRTRPLDFEIHSLTQVAGHGSGPEQPFQPFYAIRDPLRYGREQAYYIVRREPRWLSSQQRRRGPRSTYVGSETFVSLVDANQAPYRHDLRQLGLRALCTNRDLPLLMPVGTGKSDFTLEDSAPVLAVRCLAGPSRPRPSRAHDASAWRLISQLSLNYLSLSEQGQGAAALRELLRLYGDPSDSALQLQIEGLRQVRSTPCTRRLPMPGPIVFGRGLEISLEFDENAFRGTGVYLLGAVFERFLARYVSINSFTETVLRTTERGEIMRWQAHPGCRPNL
jgi:type VI secretion system protein ImpG